MNYEIIFVLDPSKDNTEQLILENLNNNPKIKLIKLSRRFGQPVAILAGIHHAQFDNAVFIDVDLQDPPELIIDMYKYSKQGYETI